ncbi:hypothetical protein D1872_288810 [compost metagenome]
MATAPEMLKSVSGIELDRLIQSLTQGNKAVPAAASAAAKAQAPAAAPAGKSSVLLESAAASQETP